MGVGRVIFKNTVPDERMFELLFGEGYDEDLEIDLAAEDGPTMQMAELEMGLWDGSASRFTDEQYRRSCLVDTGQGEGKSRYKLPVREPNGKLNAQALTAAYQALAGARGGVKLSPEQKKAALRKLRGLFRRVGKEVPDGLKKLADVGDDQDLDEAIYELAQENMAKSQSKYTDDQWRRACVVEEGSHEDPGNMKHALPVMNPDGTIDERALKGATRKLITGKWSQEVKRRAAQRLVRLYRQIDENPPDTLLGLAGHTREGAMYYTDHAEDAAFVITPLNDESEVELAEADSDGKVRFWKQLLPYRKFTYQKEGVKATVNVTRKFAEKIVKNFGKAPEYVQLLMAADGDHHGDGPANTAGEIEKVEQRTDGIYGLCAVMKDKAEILKQFPKMGISVGLNTNYVRREDGRKFGPIIFHGAVTPRPYLHGMKPWQLVLQEHVDLAEVINLAEGEYEVIEAELEEGDAPENEGGETQVKVTVVDGRVVVLDDDGNEVEGATLSDEDLAQLRGRSDEGSELEGRVTTLSETLENERRERREDRNEYRMNTDYRQVPPAFRKLVLPLINLAGGVEGQEITLSEGVGDQKKERTLSAEAALWELADYMKENHAVQLGERGNQEEEPEEKAEDVQIAELADQYAKENDLTYAEALLEVQRGERPKGAAA